MTVAIEQRRLLWVGGPLLPENVSTALNGRWDVARCPVAAAAEQLSGAALVLVAPSQEHVDTRMLTRLLDAVDLSDAVAVVLLPKGLPESKLLARRRGQYVLMDADASPAELAAGIEAAAALQPTIRNLQNDVAAVRSFGRGVPQAFEEVDEELRLAARLQRDFLPHSLPQVRGVRFAALFRPAGWVSGDIYDVFRLDEEHVGFYVADVAGHGMPAALLTMFLKRSLKTKRIFENTYEILAPDAALSLLNDDMCDQELTSCHFCTAVYGVINTRSLKLQYARGGHPVPLLLDAGGGHRRLDAAGPLLGVFPEETFETRQVALGRGDRLVVFSDGLEDTICPRGRPDGADLLSELAPLRRLPPEEMLLRLAGRIDAGRDDSRHGDDVTVLVMDVAAE